jgi:hypothetical protein
MRLRGTEPFTLKNTTCRNSRGNEAQISSEKEAMREPPHVGCYFLNGLLGRWLHRKTTDAPTPTARSAQVEGSGTAISALLKVKSSKAAAAALGPSLMRTEWIPGADKLSVNG